MELKSAFKSLHERTKGLQLSNPNYPELISIITDLIALIKESGIGIEYSNDIDICLKRAKENEWDKTKTVFSDIKKRLVRDIDAIGAKVS